MPRPPAAPPRCPLSHPQRNRSIDASIAANFVFPASGHEQLVDDGDAVPPPLASPTTPTAPW
jgi:hypothetical protein